MFSFKPVDPSKIVVRVLAGDRQLGVEGDTLAPIIAQVTDLEGVPQGGVAVSWKVNDDGVVIPLSSVTDENGKIEARWLLGRQVDHEGVVRVKDGAEDAFSAAEPNGHPLDLLEVGLLRPRTYDGSNETVHPDFVRTPGDWGAYSQHIALTPYPNGQNAMENPSVFVTRSGYRWFPQAGVKNPIVAPIGGGYLSDPDVVYVPTIRELWMYYRKVDSRNRVYMVRSTNGSDWSAPIAILDAANHMMVSPSVVRREDGSWLMYSVNGGVGGCGELTSSVELRRSADGIHWGKPVGVAISNDGQLTPWHIEVQWVPAMQQYWALYPAKIPGSCATRDLFLATSADGVKWQMYPTPVLEAGQMSELHDIVYRSTFEYDATTDEVRFWFSGANAIGGFYNWRTVLQRRKRADLFTQISAPRTPTFAPVPIHTLPILTNPP